MNLFSFCALIPSYCRYQFLRKRIPRQRRNQHHRHHCFESVLLSLSRKRLRQLRKSDQRKTLYESKLNRKRLHPCHRLLRLQHLPNPSNPQLLLHRKHYPRINDVIVSVFWANFKNTVLLFSFFNPLMKIWMVPQITIRL